MLFGIWYCDRNTHSELVNEWFSPSYNSTRVFYTTGDCSDSLHDIRMLSYTADGLWVEVKVLAKHGPNSKCYISVYVINIQSACLIIC